MYIRVQLNKYIYICVYIYIQYVCLCVYVYVDVSSRCTHTYRQREREERERERWVDRSTQAQAFLRRHACASRSKEAGLLLTAKSHHLVQ